MLHLILALQSVGAGEIPANFDIRKVKPSPDTDTIIVTAQRSQRIEPIEIDYEPPLGRAEMGLFGNAKGNVHVGSKNFGNGTTAQRVMVEIKLPF